MRISPREPIEDYRIDSEDGFGFRSDAEEDAEADAAAVEAAGALAAGRALSTLRRGLSELLQTAGGRLPANFCVTLPKVTVVEQVRALVEALRPYPDVAVEIMIETPGALFALPDLVEAAGRRLSGPFWALRLHCESGVNASNQDISHPACDFARKRNMMLAALADTVIALADGPTVLSRGKQFTRPGSCIKETSDAGWTADFIRTGPASGAAPSLLRCVTVQVVLSEQQRDGLEVSTF